MKIFLAYPKRSCVTGLALRKALGAKKKRSNKRAKCNVFIRYGSTEEFSNLKYDVEINSLEAVRLATNKLAALQRIQAEEIPCINFSSNPEEIESFLDSTGNCYIRSRAGVVRYGNDFNPSRDSYFSQPVINKRREYRVHVFNGRVIGIYEKVPMIEGRENAPKLFKSDTCKFVRCNPENCRLSIEDQELCIRAVQALGLDFAGVDLIRDKDQNVFICEVNSAAGLNSQMLIKYVEEIRKFANDDN